MVCVQGSLVAMAVFPLSSHMGDQGKSAVIVERHSGLRLHQQRQSIGTGKASSVQMPCITSMQRQIGWNQRGRSSKNGKLRGLSCRGVCELSKRQGTKTLLCPPQAHMP